MLDTTSLWHTISHKTIAYPKLNEDIDVDIAIIGSGITGITTAMELIKAGKKIAIFDAGTIGGGTTGSSTGNLYVAVQPYYQNIVKKFNLEIAKNIAHSRKYAIDYIEMNIKEKNINCHFTRRPWYAYVNDETRITFLEKELETIKKLDISINKVNSIPLPFKFKKAAVMEGQARFNPLQYVISIAEYLKKNGSLIFENTRVTNIDEKDICTLQTSTNCKVTAKKVIIATHTPIGINLAQLYTAPYRSYVVAVRLKDNLYPEGHFWDFDVTHHSTCTHAISANHPELLVVAGNHHKTGQNGNMKEHYDEHVLYLRKHFQVADIAFQWSAQHYHSADNVPYIGLASRYAKHTYIATGFFSDGLIYGTLAGILLGDVILKKSNALLNIYNSNRFTPMASAKFLIKENTNTLMQYCKDLPMSPAHDFTSLKTGQAKILWIENEKWGCYRDEHEKLHVVCAVCPHMKCIVNWNDAEKTWDCPCHGSRFTYEGKLIEGPATTDLRQKESL